MFRRENWSTLIEVKVIQSMTTRKEGNIKNELKTSMFYLLLKAADILQGEALMLKRNLG